MDPSIILLCVLLVGDAEDASMGYEVRCLSQYDTDTYEMDYVDGEWERTEVIPWQTVEECYEWADGFYATKSFDWLEENVRGWYCQPARLFRR